MIRGWIYKARIDDYIELCGEEQHRVKTYSEEASKALWCIPLTPYFDEVSSLFGDLLGKMEDRAEINFIGEYFLPIFPDLLDNKIEIDILIDALAEMWRSPSYFIDEYGAIDPESTRSNFRDDLQKHFFNLPNEWQEKIIKKIQELGVPQDYEEEFEKLKAVLS